MASMNLTLSGNGSSLTTNIHPGIELDERFNYSCCLLDAIIHCPTWKTVVDDSNNKFPFTFNGSTHTIAEGHGEHTLSHIAEEIERKMASQALVLSFILDKQTMIYRIELGRHDIRIGFDRPDTVRSIFGFESIGLLGEDSYWAENSVHNFNADTIRFNCDLVNGSFHNGIRTHTLHEFQPTAIVNYKMIEHPHHLIHLPVIKRYINSVNVTVTDQDGQPIVLNEGSKIICRINIKRDSPTPPTGIC